MPGGGPSSKPAPQELLTLAPFALAALTAWLPIVPGGLAYDLSEIALVYAGVLIAWRAGAATVAHPSDRPFLIVAVAMTFLAILPAGTMFLPASDFFRCGVVILVIIYLAMKRIFMPRIAFWSAMCLALILARTLISFI
jgi:hypothetical protein